MEELKKTIETNETYQSLPDCVKNLNPFVQFLLALVIVLGTFWLIKIILGFFSRGEGFSNSSNTFILYYVDWCPHCRNFKPTWDKLTDIVAKNKTLDVTLVKINCEEQPQLCQNDGVTGYPTIKLKKGNGDVIDYNTPDRSMGALIQFLKQNL